MKAKFILFLFLFPFKFSAQCYTFTLQTTMPSCPTCCDGSASVENIVGGCGPFFFNWSPGIPIGDGTDSIGGICSGQLVSVTIHDMGTGNCCSDSIVFCCIDCPTSMNNYSINNINYNFKNSILKLENIPINSTINLYDITGKKIISKASFENYIELDISSLSTQIYLLSVVSEKGNIIFKQKFIKQ
ncbi:MAG: T9SS type A sorting domain-containing protein [Bacteroidia bacterium]|nr:T9SS type A sorting domain-containing protein [Bacteroidia bacterium]